MKTKKRQNGQKERQKLKCGQKEVKKNTKRKYKQILFEMWQEKQKRKYKQLLLFSPPQFRPQPAFPSSIINSHFEESRIV